MLAVGMNGEPLPVEHGFPVRMVVPGPLRLRVGHAMARRAGADAVRRLRRVLDPARLVAAGPDQDRSRGSTRRATARDRDRRPGHGRRGRVGAAPGRRARSRSGSTTGRGSAATLAAVPSVDTWRQWTLAVGRRRRASTGSTVRATDNGGRDADRGSRRRPTRTAPPAGTRSTCRPVALSPTCRAPAASSDVVADGTAGRRECAASAGVARASGGRALGARTAVARRRPSRASSRATSTRSPTRSAQVLPAEASSRSRSASVKPPQTPYGSRVARRARRTRRGPGSARQTVLAAASRRPRESRVHHRGGRTGAVASSTQHRAAASPTVGDRTGQSAYVGHRTLLRVRHCEMSRRSAATAM